MTRTATPILAIVCFVQSICIVAGGLMFHSIMGTTEKSINTTKDAISTIQKWKEVADAWHSNSDRFEKIAGDAVKTAQRCAGIIQ